MFSNHLTTRQRISDAIALLVFGIVFGVVVLAFMLKLTSPAYAKPDPVINTLPHCVNEDGSGGPTPCTWNVGPGIDGNGIGLSYVVLQAPTAHRGMVYRVLADQN